MNNSTFSEIIAILKRAYELKQKTIDAELKQKPFAILKGESVSTQVCIN